jgi:hypothetical protein
MTKPETPRRNTDNMRREHLIAVLLVLTLVLCLPNLTLMPKATAENPHALLAQLGGASYAAHAVNGMVLLGMGPNLYTLPEPQPGWSPCGMLRMPDVVRDIASQGTYAYIAAGSGGLRVVSLADTCSPAEVASVDVSNPAYAVAVTQGYAYLAAGSSGVAVIDIGDPIHPFLSTWVPLAGEAQRITIVGHFAYVAAGYGALRVLSLQDPARPREAGAYPQVYEALDVAIVDQYAYLAAGEDGLKILSLQDPEQPRLVTSQAIDRGIATAVDVATDSMGQATHAYIAAREGGIRVVSVHDPGAPFEVDPILAPGLPTDILLAGSTLYVPAGPAGAHAFDLKIETSPVLIASFGILCDARDIVRIGSHYIVASGELGLQSVSWHDDQLQLLGTINVPGEAVRLADSGTDVYVAARDAGLCVLSAANPRDLVLNGCVAGPGPANGVAVQDGFVYVACDAAGLWVIDATTPGSLLPVTVVDTPGQAMAVALTDGYALVADGDRGLRVIDITQLSTAQEVGRHFETPGHATGIAIAGDHAFLTDGGEGLHIISLADPLRPEIVGSQPLPGAAFDVQVLDSLAFVAAERAGLQIVSIAVLELPCVWNSVPLPGATIGLHVEQSEGPVLAAALEAGLLAVDVRLPKWTYLPLIRQR